MISFVLDIIQIYNYTSNLSLDLMLEGSSNDGIPMDPVRWWPSGVPQSLAVVASAISVFRMLGNTVSPRARFLSSIAAAGATAANITYHSAVENSVGFNRLMFGLTNYQKTGVWPSLDEVSKNNTDSQINNKLDAILSSSENTPNSEGASSSNISNTTNTSNTSDTTSSVSDVVNNNYIGDENPIVNIISEAFNSIPEFGSNFLFKLFEAREVVGFIDDLLGQQLIIYFSLFIILISLSLFILIFFWNLFIFSFRDIFLSYFTNKYVVWFIKYQIVLFKVSLVVLPILILFNLFILGHGLYFLITHPIPYDTLNIDLHTYVEYIPKK